MPQTQEKKLKTRKRERKAIYYYLRTGDTNIFYNLNNNALKLILINKADELRQIRNKALLISTVYKMREMLMSNIGVNGSKYTCKICGMASRNRNEIYTHILSQHNIF